MSQGKIVNARLIIDGHSELGWSSLLGSEGSGPTHMGDIGNIPTPSNVPQWWVSHQGSWRKIVSVYAQTISWEDQSKLGAVNALVLDLPNLPTGLLVDIEVVCVTFSEVVDALQSEFPDPLARWEMGESKQGTVVTATVGAEQFEVNNFDGNTTCEHRHSGGAEGGLIVTDAAIEALKAEMRAALGRAEADDS